jgi:hypothetical protein
MEERKRRKVKEERRGEITERGKEKGRWRGEGDGNGKVKRGGGNVEKMKGEG